MDPPRTPEFFRMRVVRDCVGDRGFRRWQWAERLTGVVVFSSLFFVPRCFCFWRVPRGQVEFQQVGQIHFEELFVQLSHLFRWDAVFVGGWLGGEGAAGGTGIFAEFWRSNSGFLCVQGFQKL